MYVCKSWTIKKAEVKWSESHSLMSNSLQPHGLYSSWNSLGQNTGVGRLSLLQGIFPTQGSNPGLLHCRQILYQLSHKGSPRILEWVASPFSNPGFKLGSPSLQVDSLPTELSGKPWRRLSTKELMLSNCDAGEDSWESLGLQKNKLVNLFIGRTDAEAQILWPSDAKSWLIGKDPDARKDWGQKEKGMTEDEMVGWHHWLNGHEFEQAPGDGEG